MAKQQGYEGSTRPLILSLLFDHCFLLHPAQQSFIENKEPLATLGSLVSHSQSEVLCAFISKLIESEEPIDEWKKIGKQIKVFFCNLRSSSKHMNGRSAVFESSQAKRTG